MCHEKAEIQPECLLKKASICLRLSLRENELVELHQEADGKKQAVKMKHFGDVLSDIVMPDLQTSETESSLEINFIVGKLKHTVKRRR